MVENFNLWSKLTYLGGTSPLNLSLPFNAPPLKNCCKELYLETGLLWALQSHHGTNIPKKHI